LLRWAIYADVRAALRRLATPTDNPVTGLKEM
jgi:hypothetical protein